MIVVSAPDGYRSEPVRRSGSGRRTANQRSTEEEIAPPEDAVPIADEAPADVAAASTGDSDSPDAERSAA